MNHLRFSLILILLLIIFQGSGCNKNGAGNDDVEEFPDLSGKYLGQEPPGMQPELFAQAVLHSKSTSRCYGAPVFSPDGEEMYFGKYSKDNGSSRNEIYYSGVKDGKWTRPARADFGTSFDNSPVFSSDGSKLYFFSNRQEGPGIFYVQKDTSGWYEPVKVNIPENSLELGFQFSIADNNNIYLEFWTGPGNLDIYMSECTDTDFGDPEILNINSDGLDFTPYVDPYEEYLIFSSDRPGGFGGLDLYICYKIPNGSWTIPLNLGEKVNSEKDELWPAVSPDGEYLFFVRNYEPYWIDSKVKDFFK